MSAKPRTSLWAIASLVCSVLVCPPLCVIGPVLGLIGLAQIRFRPGYKGRVLAIAGVAIGLGFCVAWGIGGVWWHNNVRRPLLDGPRDALVAGLDGDVPGFAAAFEATGDELEAAAFLSEITRRYGRFVVIEQDPNPDAATVDRVDTSRPVVPYLIHFDQETVPAEAQFVRSGENGFPMILQWGFIVLHDAERGDLAYPVSALPTDALPDAQPPRGPTPGDAP